MLIKNEVLHDKVCPYLGFQGDKKMQLDDLIDWAKRYRCCQRCRRIALVHNGITDIENFEAHYNFFDRHKVSLDVLKDLFVNHQAQITIAGVYIEIHCDKDTYKIVEPKTESGVRQIPMTEEVAECFKRIIQNRVKPKTEPMIDGHVGFIFLDKDGRPMVAMHWEKYFQHICQKYNSIYKVQMPKVTPHVCRHTFCSRMAAARMNPKTLQYIMGHSDIGVTLNVYTHLGFDEASEEINRIAKEKKKQPAVKEEKITELKVVGV